MPQRAPCAVPIYFSDMYCRLRTRGNVCSTSSLQVLPLPKLPRTEQQPVSKQSDSEETEETSYSTAYHFMILQGQHDRPASPLQ